MSLPGGSYGGVPRGPPAPQTGGGAWSNGTQWGHFQQSAPSSSAHAQMPAGYGQFQQAPSLHVPGQISQAASTGFAPTSGWQGPQASFQPQYPGYAQQQPGYLHQQPGYPTHQQAGYPQQQPGYFQQHQPVPAHVQAGYQQQQPGYGQQQQQQQAHYQLQQQQKMLREQQARLAKEQQQQKEAEEKRQRELEKQKFALMSINVAKPHVAGSDLESRIGLSLATATSSSKPKPSQSATATSSTESDKKAASESPTPQNLPVACGSEVTSTSPSSSGHDQDMGWATTLSDVMQPAVTTVSGPSVDQLLADSLSNLQLKSNQPLSKADFKKFSQPMVTVGGTSLPATMQKKYTPSEKSHNWTGSATDFSGIFAEHSQHELMHEPGAFAPEDPFLSNLDGSLQSAPLLSHSSSSPVPPSGVASAGPGSQAADCRSPAGGKFSGTAPIVAVPPSRSPQLTRSYTQPQQSSLQVASAAKFSAADLPFWIAPCLHGPAPVPPLYNSMHQLCCIPDSELTVTEKLFPVLMSSGLERAMLGRLWAVVNLTVPGQLTRVELFVLLGLIGLVQEGKPGTLAELKVTTQPPIPRLSLLQSQVPMGGVTPPITTRPVVQAPMVPVVLGGDDFGDFQASATPPLSRAQHPSSNSPAISKGTGEPPPRGVSPVFVAAGSQFDPPLGGLQLHENPLHPPLAGEKNVVDDPYSALRALAVAVDATSGCTDSSDRYSPFREMTSQNLQPVLPETPVIGVVSTSSNSSASLSSLQSVSLLAAGQQASSTYGVTATDAATVVSRDDFGSFASFTSSSIPATQSPSTVATVMTQKPAQSDAFKDLDLFPAKTSGQSLPVSSAFDELNLFPAKMAVTSMTSQSLSISTTSDELNLFPAKVAVTSASSQSLPVSTTFDELNLFPAKVVVTSASSQSLPVSTAFDELNLFPAKVVVTSASSQSLSVSTAFDELNLFPAKVAVTSAGSQSLPVSTTFDELNLFPGNMAVTSATSQSPPDSSAFEKHNFFSSVPVSSISTEPAAFSSSATASNNWADFTSFVVSAPVPPTTRATPTQGTTTDLFSQQPTAAVTAAAPPHGTFADFSDFTGLVATPAVTMTTASNGTSVLDALPQMENKEITSPSSSTSEFGEFAQFQPARSSSTSVSRGSESEGSTGKLISQYDMWKKCLTKCCELLEASVATLSQVSDTSILEEIARSEEARNKLRGIAELFRFAKRIHVASKGPGKKMMTPSKNESLNESMMEVKKQWNAIVKLLPNNIMTQILDSMSSPATLTDEDSQTCYLCLLPKHIFISPLVTIDGCSDHYTLETTEQNGRLLHVQCANFWTRGLGESLTFSVQ